MGPFKLSVVACQDIPGWLKWREGLAFCLFLISPQSQLFGVHDGFYVISWVRWQAGKGWRRHWVVFHGAFAFFFADDRLSVCLAWPIEAPNEQDLHVLWSLGIGDRSRGASVGRRPSLTPKSGSVGRRSTLPLPQGGAWFNRAGSVLWLVCGCGFFPQATSTRWPSIRIMTLTYTIPAVYF